MEHRCLLSVCEMSLEGLFHVVILDAEHDSRGFEQGASHAFKFLIRHSRMVTVQKHYGWKGLGIPLGASSTISRIRRLKA